MFCILSELELTMSSKLVLQPLPCGPIVADELYWFLAVSCRFLNTDPVFQEQLHNFCVT